MTNKRTNKQTDTATPATIAFNHLFAYSHIYIFSIYLENSLKHNNDDDINNSVSVTLELNLNLFCLLYNAYR